MEVNENIENQKSNILESVIVRDQELRLYSMYNMEMMVKCFGMKTDTKQFQLRHFLNMKQIDALCKRARKKHGIGLDMTSQIDEYGNFGFMISGIDERKSKDQKQVEIPIVNPVDDVVSNIFECSKSYVMDDGFTFILHHVYSAATLVKYFGNETSQTYFEQYHKIERYHRIAIANVARSKYGLYFTKFNQKDEYRGRMYVLSRIGHPNEQLLLQKMNKNIYQYMIPIFLGKILQASQGSADTPIVHATKHSLYTMTGCANQNYIAYASNFGAKKILSELLNIPHDTVMQYFSKFDFLCSYAMKNMIRYLESCDCLYARKIYKGSVNNVAFAKNNKTGNKQIFVRMDMKETLTKEETDAYRQLLSRLDKELHIKDDRERWFGKNTSRYKQKMYKALRTDGLCGKRYKYVYQATEIVVTDVALCMRILKHLYHIDDVKNYDFTLLYEKLDQFIYERMMPEPSSSDEERAAITLLNETLVKHDAELLQSEYVKPNNEEKYDIFVNSTYLGNLSGTQNYKDNQTS